MRRIAVLLATMASPVGILMLGTLAGPALKSGPFPHPAEAASAMTVTVGCNGNPEITRVKNNTNRRITIGAVGSIYQPRSNEPFYVNRTLAAGRSVSFESGYAADSNTLTRQYIYNSGVDSKEGAKVTVSAKQPFPDWLMPLLGDADGMRVTRAKATDEQLNWLIDQGWYGKASDGIEALYPPQHVIDAYKNYLHAKKVQSQGPFLDRCG